MFPISVKASVKQSNIPKVPITSDFKIALTEKKSMNGKDKKNIGILSDTETTTTTGTIIAK